MARKGMNIYKRKDGRWEGRYIRGRSPDGKAIFVSVYGNKYSEVRTKLLPLKHQYSDYEKVIIPNCRNLLKDWLAYWLENIIKPNVKPSTYASYHNKLKNHILPAFGNKNIEALTKRDIQQFVNALADKGLVKNSVLSIFRVLNAAMSRAEEINAITVNPCKEIKLPQNKKTGVEALALSQQKSLEKVALQDKDGAAVIIALYTGMRIGEICALEWANVDFESGTLHVRQTAERISFPDAAGAKSRIVFNSPKTANSCRVIPLPEHFMAYLYKLKTVADSDYVVSCKGGFAEPRIVRYRFHRMLGEAGLPPMRFHCLRHTFATRCIERNVDITTLSRLLGHKSPTLTLDTYTDSLLQQRKIAMSVMDELFIDKAVDAAVQGPQKERIIRFMEMLFEQGAAVV